MAIFFLCYFLLINLIGFYLMYADKRKAAQKAWRIPESNLLFLCLAGGFGGIFLGMKYLRHKSQQWRFHSAVLIAAFIWVLFIPFLYYYYVLRP